MLADVLTSAASWNSEQPLLTYSVPAELEERLCPGQLIAVPYGERLVEGVVWNMRLDIEEPTIVIPSLLSGQALSAAKDLSLRPISAILDVEPALLPHQRALAEWMAEYYVTPLAQIAFRMLPPGLMQRSRVVLHVVKSEQHDCHPFASLRAGSEQSEGSHASLRLQALIGLLLADGELDIEQLKKMLGPKRAREVLKEALESGLIEREAQLSDARAKKRIKRVVRLVAQGEALEAWRQRTEAQIHDRHPFASLRAGSEQSEGSHASLRLQALIGLLLADGELDIEQLKKMLGSKRAREILKEALESGLIEREAQLSDARAKKRIKRVVRLVAQGESLEAWRQRTEAQIHVGYHPEQSEGSAVDVNIAPDNVRRRPKKSVPDPWAIAGTADVLTLTPQDRASLAAQRQLAAIDLLQYSGNAPGDNAYWVPSKLCKASKLTPAQLQALVREHIVVIEEIEVQRDPLSGRVFPPSAPLALTPDQQNALEHILATIDNTNESAFSRGLVCHPFASLRAGSERSEGSPPAGGEIKPILLHGVTGSGKTEVYLQALAAIIAQGKRGIVLVPEIVLTTQAIQRFAGRFPGRVAIIHGDLFIGERYDEWRRIRSGKVDVVIGSRSALFSPLPDLGLIILDEEHEPAYKQGEQRPSYHAREAAITLGRMLHIPVVLGSATPSVETFYRAEQGVYSLVELPGRIGATLPPVEIIDLRSELHAGNTSIISRRLQSELEHVLGMEQQAILFLNRRGAASCVLCRDCGFVVMCDRCDVPMTYHSTERILLCHYCNRQSKVLHACPQCKSTGIRYFGLGTEKVMDTIQRSFPTARLLRWDRDTASNHRAHQALLDRFANRQADILVGTQMIAKGLDLPGVTLVGVVSADIALNLPDFAASERAFTLLTQVAGRAGRGEEAGKVIIQTFNPQHFCIDAASRHDYHEFYAAEIDARRRYGYPPFRRFVKFTYSHENRRRSQNEALLLRERVDEWIERLCLVDTDVVGPAPALMERVRNKYRWQMIVRGPDLHPLLRVIDAPGWEVDIDPVSTI